MDDFRKVYAEALDRFREELERQEQAGNDEARCSCCGRPLTDPESIALGIGPVCRGKKEET